MSGLVKGIAKITTKRPKGSKGIPGSKPAPFPKAPDDLTYDGFDPVTGKRLPPKPSVIFLWTLAMTLEIGSNFFILDDSNRSEVYEEYTEEHHMIRFYPIDALGRMRIIQTPPYGTEKYMHCDGHTDTGRFMAPSEGEICTWKTQPFQSIYSGIDPSKTPDMIYAETLFHPNGDVLILTHMKDGGLRTEWYEGQTRKPNYPITVGSSLTNLEHVVLTELFEDFTKQIFRQYAMPARNRGDGDGGQGTYGGNPIDLRPYDPFASYPKPPPTTTTPTTPDNVPPSGMNPDEGWVQHKGTVVSIPENPPPNNPDFLPGKKPDDYDDIPIVEGVPVVNATRFPNYPSWEKVRLLLGAMMTAAAGVGGGIAIDEDGDPQTPPVGENGEICTYIPPGRDVFDVIFDGPDSPDTEAFANEEGVIVNSLRMQSSPELVGPGMIGAAMLDGGGTVSQVNAARGIQTGAPTSLGPHDPNFPHFRTSAGECRYWNDVELKAIRAARRKRKKLEEALLKKMGCARKIRVCGYRKRQSYNTCKSGCCG
jgi:hypothetical protein